jgi:hypothetical protein
MSAVSGAEASPDLTAYTYVDVNGVLEEAAWDRLSISRSKSVRRSGWPVEEEFRGLRAVEGVAGRLAVVRKGGDGLCEVE